ncbi:hypothetical protein RvY_13215 [Ramazzottius varieornatus]|uniref:Guanylate cyclase domain-containing protein n=1 Tax=Ramazzottius varieornatus TaxID=947166 RepID=A0A1D1VVP8_RAMVA|nr:hypothetical protein RvY_13215 [Ramazzottius varieornatus]
MESHGEPGKIQCSDATKNLLDVIGGFVFVERGHVEIKGKGPMKTFWIVAKE